MTPYDHWKTTDFDGEDALERAEAIDGILAEFWKDDEKVREADEWNDGMQSAEHYSEVERALADLAAVPTDKLIGSDALATVLRLAKVHGDAREARLEAMASDEYDRLTARPDDLGVAA